MNDDVFNVLKEVCKSIDLGVLSVIGTINSPICARIIFIDWEISN